MMDVFSPSFGVFFWQLVSFLLLLFLAKKFFLKKIVDTLQQRAEHIEGNLRQAKEAEEQKEKLEKENAIIAADINKMMRESKDRIDSWEREEIEKSKEKINEYRQNGIMEAKNDIERNKQKILSESKKEINNITVNLVERLLKDSTIFTQENNIRTTRKMIDELIRKDSTHNSKNDNV